MMPARRSGLVEPDSFHSIKPALGGFFCACVKGDVMVNGR